MKNFSAAKNSRPVSDGFDLRFSLSVFPVFRTGGPGLPTISRSKDFELYRPALRLGLTLNDYYGERFLFQERLFYIAVTRSSLAEDFIAKKQSYEHIASV